MQSNTRGFTLIELLVVVAIIGMLASVIIASLSSARVKARDAQRIASFHSLSLAIALYADNNGGNFPSCTVWTQSTDATWNCLVTALAPYIKVPVDPLNNNANPWTTGNYSYAYGLSQGGKDYDLVGQLESVNNPYRCQLQNWIFHYYGLNLSWCSNYGYSNYLFSEH